MLGPMYLHWDGSYHTYQRFLSHLQRALRDIEQNIIFGTDGEKALSNAIKTCFPTAIHTLCTRHLKENLIHNLKNVLAHPEIKHIINAIFCRTSGLLTLECDASYEEKENEIKENNIP